MIATPNLDADKPVAHPHVSGALTSRSEATPRALPSEPDFPCAGARPSPWSPRDSELLSAYLSAEAHPLPEVAARAGIPLSDLLDWLDLPHVAARLRRIEHAVATRARILAAESAALSIDALRTAALIHLQVLNTADPVKVARLADIARKSANQLLRIAGIPHQSRSTGPRPVSAVLSSADTPTRAPEREASRPPTRPSTTNEASSPLAPARGGGDRSERRPSGGGGGDVRAADGRGTEASPGDTPAPDSGLSTQHRIQEGGHDAAATNTPVATVLVTHPPAPGRTTEPPPRESSANLPASSGDPSPPAS